MAFLGGSITYNPGWRDMTCAYLTERFPETTFDFVAAGIPRGVAHRVTSETRTAASSETRRVPGNVPRRRALPAITSCSVLFPSPPAYASRDASEKPVIAAVNGLAYGGGSSVQKVSLEALAELLQEPGHVPGGREEGSAVQPQGDVLGHRVILDEHEMLVNHADPQSDGIMGAANLDGASLEADLPLLGLFDPEYYLHQRGFAGPVFSQKGVDFAHA